MSSSLATCMESTVGRMSPRIGTSPCSSEPSPGADRVAALAEQVRERRRIEQRFQRSVVAGCAALMIASRVSDTAGGSVAAVSVPVGAIVSVAGGTPVEAGGCVATLPVGSWAGVAAGWAPPHAGKIMASRASRRMNRLAADRNTQRSVSWARCLDTNRTSNVPASRVGRGTVLFGSRRQPE